MKLISPAGTGTEPRTVWAAANNLAKHATGADDLRLLLEACGLIPMQPAASGDLRAFGRCPSCKRRQHLAAGGVMCGHNASYKTGAPRCSGSGKAPVDA